MKRLIALLALLLTGCASKTPAVAVHPGSISNLDSYAYDVLLVEQDAITAARADFLAGNLPAAAKDPLNSAIAQYNLAQSAWQGYHASGGDSTALQQALNALVAAVGSLQAVLGKPVPKPITPSSPMSWLGQEVYNG